MKIKIKVFANMIGESGQSLEAGNVYEVKPATATISIQTGRARIAETSLVKVRILRDDMLDGLRRGEVVEMPASGAEKLIKEYKAEFFSECDGDENSPKVKILITENTYAEVDGRKGTVVEAGKTYFLKPSDAAIFIGMGKARFPDTAVMAEIKFNNTAIFKGRYFKANDTAKLPVNDAEELIKKNLYVVELVSIEEVQEIEEEKKKSFFDKVLGK